MTQPVDGGVLVRRVTLIGTIALAMGGAIIAADDALAKRQPAVLPVPVRVSAAVTPIAAEASVFRTRPGTLASAPDAERRTTAHPRTLATFRALRAYPGAPPRVPHGLTRDELHSTHCNTCHERGGYVTRFAAYAPVTPHPELSACLQCHAVDAAVSPVALPDRAPDAVCRQCHAAGGPAAGDIALDWRSAAWPALARSDDGTPPAIPHELALRGNCLACHMGPAAIAEIRTTHPERADCRACHVEGAR